MKLFKKTIAILALAALSMSMVACGSSKANTESATNENRGEVIAKVNDVSIYKADLDAQMAQMDYYMQIYYGPDYKSNAEVMAQYYDYRDDVVNSLVEGEVLVLKAKENKEINVTDQEVEDELEVTKAGFASEDEFNTALEQSGMVLEDLKANIAKNIYVNKLIEYYAGKAEVTDEEINEYYNTNIASYTTKAGANLSHILVDSKEKANEVLEKYKAGTSFEDLAAEYGTDGTATQGGSLGYTPYDTNEFDADFMAGAQLVGEGEVSEPVETQFGWHLIKADGIQKEDKVQSLDEVKEDIKLEIAYSKATEELTSLLEDWKKDYEIQIFEEVIKADDVDPAASPEASSEASESPEASSEPEASESPEVSSEPETTTNPEASTAN